MSPILNAYVFLVSDSALLFEMTSSKRAADQVQARGLLDSRHVTLGKCYKIERKEKNVLGAGGFGVVWLGVDTRNKESVAVKQVQRNRETEKFCDRELKFMQVCKHENIVRLIDFIKDEKSFFFILEFCAGNLDEFVKEKDIDFYTCLDYIMDICEGVRFMHSREIGHRDIKPTNVLVKNDQRLKLADFGLSRVLTDSSSGESATGGVGSVPWIAPEVATAKGENASTAHDAKTNKDSKTSTSTHTRLKYGPSVDIFSLGLLFLSLITHIRGKHLSAHTGMYFACGWGNITVSIRDKKCQVQTTCNLAFFHILVLNFSKCFRGSVLPITN